MLELKCLNFNLKFVYKVEDVHCMAHIQECEHAKFQLKAHHLEDANVSTVGVDQTPSKRNHHECQ